MQVVLPHKQCSSTDLPRFSDDPFLFDPVHYAQAREKNRALIKPYFEYTLQRASRFAGFVREFCDFLGPYIEQANARPCRVDPYYSTILRTWIDGLQRGLEAVDIGGDPSFLDFFVNLPALKADLACEFPELAEGDAIMPTVEIEGAVHIVPAHAIADSPRLSQRVRDCLPCFPNAGIYCGMEESVLLELSDHLRRALDLIRQLDPVAYKGFLANTHTIFVALFKTKKNSLSTRYNLPGSMVVGLSRHRLREDDIAFTASQIYHEHCHNKLSLFLTANQIELPGDETMISPVKNENRGLETILQTLYSLTIELQVRMALLSAYRAKERARAVAYLAAICYRLDLALAIFAAHPESSKREEFIRITQLARTVIAQVLREVEQGHGRHRKANTMEHTRVLQRHAWDIGQFLCRGFEITDPALRVIAKNEDRVEYIFNGNRYHAHPEPSQPSPGNYGGYIEAVL